MNFDTYGNKIMSGVLTDRLFIFFRGTCHLFFRTNLQVLVEHLRYNTKLAFFSTDQTVTRSAFPLHLLLFWRYTNHFPSSLTHMPHIFSDRHLVKFLIMKSQLSIDVELPFVFLGRIRLRFKGPQTDWSSPRKSIMFLYLWASSNFLCSSDSPS